MQFQTSPNRLFCGRKISQLKLPHSKALIDKIVIGSDRQSFLESLDAAIQIARFRQDLVEQQVIIWHRRSLRSYLPGIRNRVIYIPVRKRFLSKCFEDERIIRARFREESL